MSRKNDGGRAFPNTGISTIVSHEYSGMSLHDYFAGQYVNGICGNQSLVEIITLEEISEYAYKMADEMADEMIEEREK